MRKRLLSLFACLTVAPVAACGGEADAELVGGDGYAFEVPAGWSDVTGSTRKTTDLLGDLSGSIAELYDTSVVSGGKSDRRRISFSVRVYEDYPPGYDSRRLVDHNMAVFENPDQVDGLLPGGFDIDYARREPQRIDLGGETAYEVRYRVTSPITKLNVLQVFAMHEGTAYVATLRAVPEVFEPDGPEVEQILDSWRWD